MLRLLAGFNINNIIKDFDKMSFLNTIKKLKIFLIILTLLLIFVFILMIRQYLLNLSMNNILNIGELLLSIVLPFIIGYYYNIYQNQKSAIEELAEAVFNLLIDAKTLEYITHNKSFFENNEIINSDIYFKENYFKKEISMLYHLGIYFDNIKWYNHQMYNLPINFKEQISNICKSYLEIDPLMERYNTVSIEVFINSIYAPYHYTYHATNDILKEFFNLLISNYNGQYQQVFIDFLNDLNNVEINEYYLNGKKYYT